VAGRVIAAWPSFALTASYELLMRQIRQSGAAATTGQRGTQRIEIGAGGRPKVDVAAEAPLLPSDDVDPVVPGRSDGSAARAVGGGGRILQRQAWQCRVVRIRGVPVVESCGMRAAWESFDLAAHGRSATESRTDRTG